MKYTKLLLMAGILSACGSDSSEERVPEFSSTVNVNEVVYRLTEVEVSGDITYEDGTSQNFQNLFRHPQVISAEKIVRKTIDNQYTLQVNGQRADINVGSSGNFDSRREANQEDGCVFQGLSQAQGSALFNRIDLNYELRLNLDGEDCPNSVKEAYLGFAHKELDGLNFDILHRLRESESIQIEGSKNVIIRVRAVGVIS